MDYYHKYTKYKTKYRTLKNSNNNSNNNTYILHSPLQFENLVGILNDSVIKLGKDVPKRLRNLSADVDQPYIFGRFYFKDIPKTHIKWNVLIFDKSIMSDYDIAFNLGWHASINDKSLMFYHNDSDTIRNKKIKYVKKLINNSINDTEIDVMDHEILFQKPINIKKYLKAIVFRTNNKSKIKLIQDIVNKKYPNVKLIDNINNLN